MRIQAVLSVNIVENVGPRFFGASMVPQAGPYFGTVASCLGDGSDSGNREKSGRGLGRGRECGPESGESPGPKGGESSDPDRKNCTEGSKRLNS